MDPYLAFRSRDTRLLIASTFLSSFGIQMLSVAVSWDLYLHTRSAIVLGNVGFVQVAPYLFLSVFAGHFADRLDRGRIMVLTQMLLLGASVLLAAAPRSVAIIYTSLFLVSAARAMQNPARSAVLPQLVPPHALQNAISWNSSAFEIASVTGPALAGILLAISGSLPVYLIQCVCAVLVLACLAAIRVPPSPSHTSTATGIHALLEGVRFVWNDRLTLAAISLDLFAVLFGGAVALLPIFAVDILRTGARGLGWLRAAPSIGAVTMAFVLAHARTIQRAGKILLISVAGFGAATVVFGVSRSLGLSFLMLVLTGAFDNVSVVLRQALVQGRPPDHVRGRVLGINSIFISCSNQLGAVESGYTAAWFGPVWSVVGGGIATIAVVAAFAAASKPLRQWKQS